MNKTQRLVLLLSLLAVVLLSFVAGAYSVNKLPEEEFVHRIRLPQMDFTGQSTFEEAALALQVAEDSFLAKEVELTSERGNLTVSMQTLGADAQIDSAVDYLVSFNEEATLVDKMKVYFFGTTLDTNLAVDSEKLKAAFAESGIEQGVKNAEFSYDGGIIILEEQVGYGVDTGTLAAQLQTYWDIDFTVPASDELPLRTRDPEVSTEDLESLRSTVEAIALRSLTLRDEFGNTWDLAMADHVDWIIPTTSAELSGTGHVWGLDEDKFITYVEIDLVPAVEEEPLPAIVTESEDGTYEFHGSARFGKEIIKEDLALAIFNALVAEPDEAALDIPVTQIEPLVTVPDSLRERGITDLVGVGYSTYKTSPTNRIANVNRGFEQFNGMIIEQGAEFSFTSLMGPIDAANGWLPELVIKGDETIPEYGGGLCQVSSTMFRAALYSGLPITARKNHSYAVSYYAYPYGYGLDATVYDPNPDLKFVNDTAGDLLIQGYTDGFDAYFVFYGTYDDRTVKMEGPYSYDYHSVSSVVTQYTDELEPGVRVLEEYAHTGFKVDWYRTITYGDGTVSERENIHSDYEARPAKYSEGTAVSGEEEVSE